MNKKSNQNSEIIIFRTADEIISDGYRIKSIRGTEFRKWATICCSYVSTDFVFTAH
ncbi:MAG: virulence RhuM family protein [Spirochaetales bacterium]|nr:virulence RhuM family protein [Spirochaetales bacterium]